MKKRGLLCMLLMAILALTSLTALACNKKEGSETGVYYFAAEDDEYRIALNSGNRFSFQVKDANKSGTYSLSGQKLTLTFSNKKDKKINATLQNNNVLTLPYDGVEMRFLRRLHFEVVFHSNGGSEVPTKSVLNGQTVSVPVEPTYENHRFFGWYTDNTTFKEPFNFSSEPITSKLDLYAYWVEEIPGRTNYTIKFELNFPKEVLPVIRPIEDRQTVGGKLHNEPVPADISGYAFAGWYVSMSEKSTELSYAWTKDMIFEENTTLFAVWHSTAVVAPPVVSVSSTGVNWSGPAGSLYKVEATGPNNYQKVQTDTSATSMEIPFDTLAEGKYEIKVTTLGQTPATTVRYFKNKALKRVSSFSVVEPSMLAFKPVDGATKYWLKIECGEETHSHTYFDIGNSTVYNFSGCAMMPGGIQFRIRAEAYGYDYSESEVFFHDRSLDGSLEFSLDEQTQLLSWEPVQGATNYIVSVLGGEEAYNTAYTAIDNGTKTSFSLKEATKREGGIVVTVLPTAKGYNSPQPATFNYDKQILASPRDIRLEGTTLMWSNVSGAASYNVKIGNGTYATDTNSIELPISVVSTLSNSYNVSIVAKGAGGDSAASDVVTIANRMSAEITYAKNTVSWTHVIGATMYEVQLNGGTPFPVTGGVNFAEINLTKAGDNIIEVRSVSGTNYSAWSSVTVYAYSITFDTRGGTSVRNLYKAIGDKVELPTSYKNGYMPTTIWHTSPNFVNGHAARYTDTYFADSDNITLYACWRMVASTVILDYTDGMPNEPSKAVDINYGESYALDVPSATVAADGRLFVGWFSDPAGAGTQYTDSLGKSLAPWNVANEEAITIYAVWLSAFTFTDIDSTSCSVGAGADINKFSKLVIPNEFDGKRIVEFSSNGFKNRTSLTDITIPAYMQSFNAASVFSGCSKLANIYVDANNELYGSANGALYTKDDNEIIEDRVFTLTYCPIAKSGEFVIPSGITDIHANAFIGCNQITSIIFPGTLAQIDNFALNSCTALKTVYFESDDKNSGLAISESVFSGLKNLESVYFPSHLTLINTSAFKDCSNLKIVNFAPDCRLQIIGADAFRSSGLTSITIPKYVQSIESNAFRSNASLAELFFEEDSQLTDLRDFAFASCTQLKYVNLPDSLRNIGGRVFNGCSSLIGSDEESKIMYLPAHLVEIGGTSFDRGYCFYGSQITSIVARSDPSFSQRLNVGYSAFAQQTNLVNLDFSGRTIHLEDFALNNCSNLRTVNFGKSGFTFDAGQYSEPFSGTSGIQEVYIPEGPTSLGRLLGSCADIRIIYIPASFTATTLVDTPGSGVKTGIGLAGTGSLQEVHVAEGSTTLYSSGGVLFNAARTSILFFGNNCRGPVTIPTQITTVGTIFQNKASLTGVTIHAGVTDITESTFKGCNALEFINIDANHPTLKSVDGVLYNKSTDELIFTPAGSGADYVVPDTITAIGSDLEKRTNTTKITFHANVTGLNADVFANCVSLTEIVVTGGVNYSSYQGVLYSADMTQLIYCPMAKTGSYEIPASVKTIANKAFANSSLSEITFAAPTGTAEGLVIGTGLAATNVFANSAITEIALPERLVSIGASAFTNCNQLLGVTISKNVSSIGSGAFQNCTALSFATFQTEENGASLLTTINANVFRGCESLIDINLPKTITGTIGASAFEGCIFASIQIPDGVTALGANAFKDCVNLTALNISDKLITIPASALIGCTSLAEISVNAANPNLCSVDGILFNKAKTTLIKCPAKKAGSIPIPASVTTISEYAFQSCLQITDIVFLGDATTIGQYAFQNCSARDIIIPYSITSVDTNAFDGWTAAQAIVIKGRTSIPGSWNSNWKANCYAEIFWQS